MMAHDHTLPGLKHRRSLVIALAITVCFMAGEAAVGFAVGSLVLVADAAHMLTDAAGLSIALLAIWVSQRPANERKTYGYYRSEILAALVNVALLVAISSYILFASAQRLLDPSRVHGVPVIIVASVGLGVNLVGAWLLAKGSDGSMNVKAAFLDMVSDVFGSVGAIVAGVILLTTGWRYADPLLAAVVGVVILPRAWGLLKGALDVLLEGTPSNISVAEVQQAVLGVPGVQSVHDLHVWTVTSGFVALSGHVEVADDVDRDQALVALRAQLHERFEIEHVTIQIENERLAGELQQPCFPGQAVCYSEAIERPASM
jgi:cobalt-zinc-cadmium efflux system protein